MLNVKTDIFKVLYLARKVSPGKKNNNDIKINVIVKPTNPTPDSKPGNTVPVPMLLRRTILRELVRVSTPTDLSSHSNAAARVHRDDTAARVPERPPKVSVFFSFGNVRVRVASHRFRGSSRVATATEFTGRGDDDDDDTVSVTIFPPPVCPYGRGAHYPTTAAARWPVDAARVCTRYCYKDDIIRVGENITGNGGHSVVGNSRVQEAFAAVMSRIKELQCELTEAQKRIQVSAGRGRWQEG